MTKSSKTPDRRALIATAAAAAALAPAAAEAQPRRPDGKPQKFVVDLGNIPMPESAAANLEQRIRRDTLDTLSRLRIKVDIQRLGPGTRGIIARPIDIQRYG